MSDIRLAYLAGILDGEGSIMVRKNTYRIRNPKYNDCKNPQYLPKIQIKMNDDRVLIIFKDLFGGTLYLDKKIYQSRNGFNTNKPMFVYHIENKSAFNLLDTLLQFLRIKREQALLVLSIRTLKDEYTHNRVSDGKFHGQPYSPELISKLEDVWLAVKRLNNSRYITSTNV